MSALPAGPELDARLAEAMGRKVCRDIGCDGENCDAPGGILCNYGEGTRWEGTTPYSSDLSTIAAACEEMRVSGRIAHWSVESKYSGCVPGATVLAMKDDHETGQDTTAVGSSPAHALTLALLSALGKTEGA